MSKLIDLKNKTFGALTVLRLADRDMWKYGRTSWVCQCRCGKTCIVTGDNLRRGISTSCGCHFSGAEKKRGNPENIEHKDYTGVKFGELTGIKRIGSDKWLWECSCGQRKIIRPSLVQTGQIQSCGHVLRETARKKVIDDNIFGYVDGTCLSVINGIVKGTIRSTNTSGVNGIRIRKYSSGKVVYQARIMICGKTINLGTFDTMDEAKAARKAADLEIFGKILDKHNYK